MFRGPITKINQTDCSIARPFFSEYWIAYVYTYSILTIVESINWHGYNLTPIKCNVVFSNLYLHVVASFTELKKSLSLLLKCCTFSLVKSFKWSEVCLHVKAAKWTEDVGILEANWQPLTWFAHDRPADTVCCKQIIEG